MKERPIIFSAPMVHAILEGRKTQTRRIYKARNGGVWPNKADLPGLMQVIRLCPYGRSGDRLWVRENWAWYPLDHDPSCVIYRADYAPDAPAPAEFGKWLPSIHMPRGASRITLEVTGMRVERLQDISEEDAIAEGIEQTEPFFGCACWRDYMEPDREASSFPDDPVGSYASLWESMHGADSWDQNPWVWVIEFRRIEP